MKISVVYLLPIVVGLSQAVPRKGGHTASDGLSIQTSSGKVHGTIDSTHPHVRQFLGIPFAQAPVGSLRWLPPKALPKSAAGQEVDATQLPPSCMQYLTTTGNSLYVRDVTQFNLQGLNRTGSTSEDCLTASIWTPTTSWGRHGKKELLPVLMFIYGGGWTTGGQDVPYQLPQQWVERTRDHIVVSFNYRLNIFGYPNAAGLDDQNVGLLDQRLAVEWVESNIAGFGGDASRITLWGQSAGAGSADYYNYAYPKDPIVSSLILDSGTALFVQPDDPTHSNFSFVASHVGCEGLDSQPSMQIECMRNVDASNIEDFVATYQDSGALPRITFRPVVDEKVVFSDYAARAAQGLISKIPAIIGTNAQDGVAFAPYNASGPNQTLAEAALLGSFFCPATETIDIRANAGLTSFRYLYSGNFTNIAPRPWMGAYHSSELPLIFGTYGDYRGPSSNLEMETSVSMQDAWVAFASGGSNGLTATGWQPYILGGDYARDFGDGVSVKDTSLASVEAMCV